ncbi:hypothetical protein CI109_104117 [Kwoniella shandongensis]|uniref:Uncharacterized protein n=1 Tax=Kwoniella shandongensis TaxID=1734106 RepID=A0AAJ8MW48_9TREE
MSAVVDTVSEAVGSASPSSALTAHQSTTDDDVETQEALHPRSSGEQPPAESNKSKKAESSSITTRIPTPHPARTSTSSRTSRLSYSAARPFPSTLTENITPNRSELTTHTAGAEVDSSDSDYGHDDSELNIPSGEPHHSGPVPNNSLDSGMTPSSMSMNTSTSTPAELLLGPQSVPFILRRRGVENQTPSRAPYIVSHSRYSNKAVASVDIRSKQGGGNDSDKENVDTKAEVRSAPGIATESFKSTKDTQRKSLSSWRQEQLRIARVPRLMPGTTARPITTLYGPLSLPYARNPSGVDATVADDSAYLSHVFGLRAAPNVNVFSTGANNTIRSVSSGTDSSGTQTTRSTSGSSIIDTSGKSSNNVSMLTEGSSYTSAGGTHHARPMVMRDPYQNIGIKKKGQGGRDVSVQAQVSGGRTKQQDIPIEEGTDQELVGDSGQRTDSINQSTESPVRDLKRRASESSLLVPKIGLQGLALSKSHADLREVTSLSPIPGSPADPVNPIQTLYGQAITSAGGHPSMVYLTSPSVDTRALDQERISEDSTSTPLRLPAYLPVFYNPALSRYEFGLPSDPEMTHTVQHHTTPVSSTPHASKISFETPTQVSKADTSENWRKRAEAGQNILRHRRSASEEPPTSDRIDKSGGPLSPPREGTIMTIDSLFEKFSHSSPQTASNSGPSVTFNPPATSAKSSSTKRPVLKPSKSNPVDPQSCTVVILGETSKSLNVNTPPYAPTKAEPSDKSQNPTKSPKGAAVVPGRPASATSAKGTPGAGKLLRKSPNGAPKGEEVKASTTALAATAAKKAVKGDTKGVKV